jgi:peptide/nickel transport system substrate-binding protein
MKRWITLTLALGLVAAACSSGGSPKDNQSSSPGGATGGAIKEGGTLRIGTNSRIDSLNPFVAFNQDAYTTFLYIYPYLVQYDTKTLDFAPYFSTSWDTSADGKDWTFHLVSGAKWSDGQPLTSDDVAWTVNTILKFAKGSTANSASYLAHVTGAEATDPATVVIHYKTPVANVLSQLEQMSILPRHVWEQYATGDGKALKTFRNDAPIVSGGPFQLVQFKKDDIALFQKNPTFFGTKPHIDAFGLKMFSNDDALIQAAKHGDVDYLEGGGGTIPATNVQTLKDAGWVIETGPGLTENDFIINSHKPDHSELLDPKVREAFAHAMDRDQIDQVVWLQYAKPAASIIPPANGVWHDSSLQPETFDISMANQLLEDAGYKKGASGLRQANGHDMAYTVITPTDLTGVDRTFQIIQASFQQIGVKLTQRALDSTAAFDVICGKDCTEYAGWDLAMWDWVPLIDPDFMLSVLTCDQFGGWSDSGYCNPEYDKLYQQQGVAIDPKQRQDIIYQMQQMIFTDRPYIMLNYVDVVEAHSKQWEGFVESPQSAFNPLSIETLTQIHQVS